MRRYLPLAFLWVGVVAGFAGFAATRTSRVAPSHLEIVAPPRTAPKQSGASDPLDSPSSWKPPKMPSEYELNLGRAIDTLRHDYPRFFSHKPDLSIFHRSVELSDPSGKRLQGVSSYERVFDMLRFLRRTTMSEAEVTYRLVYHDGSIRVRWCAKMNLRDPALGLTQLNVIDGVSVYDLDVKGKIRAHRIENIVMSGQDFAQPISLGVLWPTTRLATPELAIPFFRTLDTALLDATPQTPRRPQVPNPRASPPQASAVSGETPMQKAAREREEDAAKARQLEELRTPKKKKAGWFDFGGPQQCETSYDCDEPMVCCDLIVASVCCNGGIMIPTGGDPALQRQAIPIPVEKDSPFPPGYPGGQGGAPQYPGSDGF